MLTPACQILKRARSPDPETTAAMEAWFGGASRRYTAKVSQAPPAPAPRAPDPLVANLQLPDKFYIVAAFCDYPPERGVNPISEDTALLLYALHEQATKGPCKTPRPWAIFETQEQLNWDAWKALEQMPALEAMTLYCRTVEEDNPDWWNLLTAELTPAEKRDVLATAASCAEEYHAFVAAGKLVPPSKPSALPYLATAPAPPDGAFGLGQLSARLDELSVSRPIKPKTRGTIYAPSTLPKDPDNVTSASGMKVKLKNAQNAKAEAATDALASGAEPSALDRSAKALTTWTAAEVTGTKPAPRYQHCAWVVDGREMWISHGSLNGRRLQGTPRVLDLRTMSWSSREAREEGGGALAAVSGAAAVVAPNQAAYVFGGAERTAVAEVSDGSSTDEPEPDPTKEVMRARCLDLAEDPGPNPGLSAAKAMDWIDATAASSGPGPCPRAHHTATLVGGDVYVFGGIRTHGDGGAAWGVRQDETLGDLWAFDGAEGAWRLVDGNGPSGGVVGSEGVRVLPPTAPPSPRAGHVAAAADDRFLLVFGGADGNAMADAELHVFDTWAQRWIEPSTTGKPPAPRSGHAGCVIGKHWYIAGGGDNTAARPETHRLETHAARAGEYHWSVVNPGTGEGQAEAVGKEGLSLVPFRGATGDFLVAFGGSDGKCTDAVRVMRVSDWSVGGT